MCLSSYRLKEYRRALLEFYIMRKEMSFESGWKLLIAAVCYFKLGSQAEAMKMLAEVNENNLSFEEEIFYYGVLCMVGQEKKAVTRGSTLS